MREDWNLKKISVALLDDKKKVMENFVFEVNLEQNCDNLEEERDSLNSQFSEFFKRLQMIESILRRKPNEKINFKEWRLYMFTEKDDCNENWIFCEESSFSLASYTRTKLIVPIETISFSDRQFFINIYVEKFKEDNQLIESNNLVNHNQNSLSTFNFVENKKVPLHDLEEKRNSEEKDELSEYLNENLEEIVSGSFGCSKKQIENQILLSSQSNPPNREPEKLFNQIDVKLRKRKVAVVEEEEKEEKAKKEDEKLENRTLYFNLSNKENSQVNGDTSTMNSLKDLDFLSGDEDNTPFCYASQVIAEKSEDSSSF